MVTFRSFSFAFAFAGLAMAAVLMPTTMAFLPSQPSRMTIRTTVETMDSYVFEKPAEGMEAFLESVGLLFDIDTFLAESIDNYDFIPAKTPSAQVYSIEACTPGEVRSFVKIYWTISGENIEGKRGEPRRDLHQTSGEEESDSEFSELDKIRQAFQREVTEVFIEGIDIDGNTVRRRVNTPEDFKASLDDLEPLLLPLEELFLRSKNETFINPDAIDGSSLECKTIFDSYGETSQVFCADLTNTTTINGEKTTEQTIWWRTLDGHREKGPYGILSNVWTDQEFRALLDEANGSFGGLSTRFKYLALMILCSSVGFGVHYSAAIYLFLSGVGPLTNIPKDAVNGIMIGLIQNRPYHRALAIWVLCCVVVDKLPNKPVLNRESPLVAHLTTLSNAVRFISMNSILNLIELSIVKSLRLLSKLVAWWQRKEGDNNLLIFEFRIERLLSRMYGFIGRTPEWMMTNIYCPVTEEIYCRFVFDKVWHGLLGLFAVNSAAARNSSQWPHPSWIWASSIYFSLIHIGNWLPKKKKDNWPYGVDDDHDDDNLWSNVEGALCQCTACFLSAFFVLGPLYSKYGLTSSIAAHAAENAILAPVLACLKLLSHLVLEGGMKIGMNILREHVRLFVHDADF